jgi:multiple sugar transport system substrate-binding protein
VVTFWGRSDTDAITLKLVKQFNATHPSLNVQFTPIADSIEETKLATAIRAGAPPDLVGLSNTEVTDFAAEPGVFENLTSKLKALPFFSKLSQGHLSGGEYKGEYYGAPFIADLSVLWYNKVLFKRAGLNPNDPPTTYQQILTDAQKIRALGGNTYGFSFAGECGGCFAFAALPMAWESAAGRAMLSGPLGSTKIYIVKNPAIKALLTLYSELYAKGLTPPSDHTDNGATWGADFLQGTVGILPQGYGLSDAMTAKQIATEFGIAPLPGPTGGYSTFDGGDDLSIPAGGTNQAGAWEFIQWMLQAKQQVEYPSSGFTPVRSDLLTAQYKKQNPLDAVALKALAQGYLPVALRETQLFDLSTAPLLTMFDEAIYTGNIAKALQEGQSGSEAVLSPTG